MLTVSLQSGAKAWLVCRFWKQWLSSSKIYNPQRWLGLHFLKLHDSQNLSVPILVGINLGYNLAYKVEEKMLTYVTEK